MAVKRNFYQRTIIDSLSKMNKGCLHLTLPDGDLLKIGDEIHPIFDVGDGIQQLILLMFPIFTSNNNAFSIHTI